MLLFSSYDHYSKWNLAGEFVFRQNEGWNENRNIYAYSFYGKYNLNDRFQLFARYDVIKSNILKEETKPWNLPDDGSALISGVQISPVKNIKMSLNYQDWYPRAANLEARGFIYLNFEVKM